MRIPKNRTFSKCRKGNQGKIKGVATRGYKVTQGEFGLKALESYKMTPQQIESMRRVIVREMGGKTKTGKLFIKVFPDCPISKKNIGVRMGGGKGAVESWVCKVKEGKIIFEIAGVSREAAEHALSAASYKLPIKTKFLTREEQI